MEKSGQSKHKQKFKLIFKRIDILPGFAWAIVFEEKSISTVSEDYTQIVRKIAQNQKKIGQSKLNNLCCI